MQILFFVHSLGRTRHFKRVIAALAERGHTVVLATAGEREEQKSGKGFYDHPGIRIVRCPEERSDGWSDHADALRTTRDRVRYFDPRYAYATKLAARAIAHTPKRWNRAIERRPWLVRHWRVTQGALAMAEQAIPCDPRFLAFMREQSADLVLVTPLVEFGSYQTDYVKCAHRLGVPVAYLPFSWDNLTNRGLIRVVPDRVLVWNRFQRAEAIDLHRVPADRIEITGAPRFDEFFAMTPLSARDEFCAALGFDPARSIVLYVCSSEFIAPYEVGFVREWIAAMRRSDGWLRDCQVLVRPHPANAGAWSGDTLSDLPGVTVWNQRSTMQADQRLFDSLFHSTAVVGLNTSAMIEAAIVGRPVFTVRAADFAGGQDGTIHFHYLLSDNGGVVTLAESFDQHVRQLETAPQQEAETRERCRRFLAEFVRPHGLDRPAADVMADAIERTGTLRKRPRRTPLWHHALRSAILRLPA